jgi:UDP-glucose 4-epimerase
VVERHGAQPSRHRSEPATDATKAFAGIKILVTGSHGFIGRHLVPALQRLGADVVEYDRQTGCSVLNRRRLAESAAGTAMTFHLAGASSVIHFDEDFANAWKTTVEGLTNVLDTCGGRIVFPSTASLYGGATTPLEERRALPDPVNAYAKAKLLCEQLCFAANKDVRVLRIFSGYGPGDHAKGRAASPVAKFLASAAAGESAEIYGDGRQVRDFVFVDDIVNALIAVAKLDLSNGSRVFNVGTGTGTMFLDLIRLIRAASNLEAIDRHMSAQPKGYVGSLVAHTARAEREIGFRTVVGLSEGLKRTIQTDFPRLARQ